MKMKTFEVYLDGERITTKLYQDGEEITTDEIKTSLISDKGFDPKIEVRAMSEAKHTPLTVSMNDVGAIICYDNDYNHPLTFQINWDKTNIELAKVGEAFVNKIVRACNHHDALVSALQSMMLATSRDENDYPNDGIYDIVMAAVKKAELTLTKE